MPPELPAAPSKAQEVSLDFAAGAGAGVPGPAAESAPPRGVRLPVGERAGRGRRRRPLEGPARGVARAALADAQAELYIFHHSYCVSDTL